ncbi:alpha-amylase family glycosyl hydrolase [Isosphaeraceae bacterium EP7]
MTCAQALTMLLPIAAAPVVAVDLDRSRPWEDEVVYVVILEKFFNANPANDVMAGTYGKERSRYEGGLWGGDIEGIRSKLDDFVDLGVTSLLIYPVMQNDRRPMGKFLTTGYRPTDYFRVDENFGDMHDLKRLVADAHSRGIKVILDMPLALPGFEHPYMNDPAHAAWFGKPTEYGIRHWDADNPEVADYLVEVAKFWRDESGCDGFRMDSAPLLSTEFWTRFVRDLKAGPDGRPTDFVILAELAIDPPKIGRIVRECGFDGAYDFSFDATQKVIGKSEKFGLLAKVLAAGEKHYPHPRRMMAQVDNYEVTEFLSVAKEPKQARLDVALTLLMTMDRVPFLYAGNEVGLVPKSAGDAFPADRRDRPAYKHLKRLIAMRKAEPILRRGDWSQVLSEKPIYAFLRTLTAGKILVVLNTSDKPAPLKTDLGKTPWKEIAFDDILQAHRSTKSAGDNTPLDLGPFEARVFKVR